VTLTQGRYVGAGDDAAERISSLWNEISDRAGEIVPSSGWVQAERELASAGATSDAVTMTR
jgi:hypothetical protein